MANLLVVLTIGEGRPTLWGAVVEAVVGAGLASAGVYLLAERDRRERNSPCPTTEGWGRGGRFYRRQVYVWGPVTLIGFGVATFLASLSFAWRRGMAVWLSILTTAVIAAAGIGLPMAGRGWLRDALAAFRRD
jgi:hypothetical protein